MSFPKRYFEKPKRFANYPLRGERICVLFPLSPSMAMMPATLMMRCGLRKRRKAGTSW